MSKNFVVLKKIPSFAASNKEILHFSIQILFIKFKVPLVRAGLFHFYSHFALITREKDLLLYYGWHYSCHIN